jgi:hypothetical protein
MFPSGTPVPLTLVETVSYSPVVVIYFLDSRILATNQRPRLKSEFRIGNHPRNKTRLSVCAPKRNLES